MLHLWRIRISCKTKIYLFKGFESASVSSTCETYKSGRPSTRKEELVQAKVFSKKNREQLEKIIKYSRSSEMSSGTYFKIFK